MRKKILGSVCFVLAIIIIITTGTSFAYFSSSAGSNNSITGKTMNFDVDLKLDTVYNATQLVPLSDDLVDATIKKTSNKCIDSKGYQVCSLFKLTLTNNGDAQILNGYVSTDTTTYTTDNLKYQVFNSSYIPVSDVMTVSRTITNKVYFKKSSNMVSTTINNTNVIYYLVIWLTETNGLQDDDYAKAFSGKVGFESVSGGNVSVKFSV